MKTYTVHGHIVRRDGRSESFWTRTGLSKAVAGKLAREQRAETGGVARVVAEDEVSKSHSHHASRKKYPYIAYWIRARGPGSQRDSEPIYVLGTTTRADEGLVGHDLRVRPLRLGKGAYTMVVSPDDVEDRP